MNKILNSAEEKFNALGLREKILILFALLALLYSSWHTILYDYILATDEDISKKAAQIKQQINLLEGQIDNVSAVLGRDPTALLADQAMKLKNEKESADKKLYAAIKNMESPENMTNILTTLIQGMAGVTVVNIESMDAKPLFEQKTIRENGQDVSLQVFNRGLVIEIIAGYFETVTLLKAIEALHGKIILDELSYEVIKYPKAKVKIMLHVLSLQEGFLGG